MIKTIFAYTMELDDPEAALAELQAQIGPERNLLKNSLGILICRRGFTGPEIIRELCAALPFPVLGMASMGAAVAGHGEPMMISLAVLTGDDVFFSPGLSEPLPEEPGEKLAALYGKTLAALEAARPGEKPVMMFTLSPTLLRIPGDETVRELDRASGGLPNFGSISVDYAGQFKDSEIIYDGEFHAERLAIVLVSGNVKPSFMVHSVPEERVLEQDIVITKSSKNRVMEINGEPASAYLKSKGFSPGQGLEGLFVIPFVLRFPGGSSAVHTVLEASPEGHLIFGGAVPEGCVVSVAPISHDDVIQTAAAAVNAAGTGAGGLLMFSCFGRCLALGLDDMAEIEGVRKKLDERNIPFMFAYSGGEICPVPDSSGNLVNRFHNVSLICCSLG
jgi:hypothetical protein